MTPGCVCVCMRTDRSRPLPAIIRQHSMRPLTCTDGMGQYAASLAVIISGRLIIR